jgi:hypothetical protein
MNIFASSVSPRLSALNLDDKRANQLIRESGQLLSTTINLIELQPNPHLYENFSPNHPCRLWVGANRRHFFWLMEHMSFLLQRAPKEVHTRAREVLTEVNLWWTNNRWKLPEDDFIAFCNCAGNDGKGISFKTIKDTNLAYRLYLNARWKTDARPPTWLTGIKPVWAEV